MAEYIKREAAVDAVRRLRIGLRHDGFYKEDLICVEIQTRLESIPAADVVEVKRGKWEVDGVGCGICSECGNYAFETSTHHIFGWYPHYCPNCGARMEAEK